MALFARHVPHRADIALAINDQHPFRAETDASIAERFRRCRRCDRRQHGQRERDQGTAEHAHFQSSIGAPLLGA